jgi:hypothetical protein
VARAATVVNFFAGPGAGKTTAAMDLVTRLKRTGASVEFCPEYAKNLVWESRWDEINQQILVFSGQLRNLLLLHSRCDVVVMESPLLLSLFYFRYETSVVGYPLFERLVWDVWRRFKNINMFLHRDHTREYLREGRVQTFEESLSLDLSIKSYLVDNGVSHASVPVDGERTGRWIFDYVIKALDEEPQGVTSDEDFGKVLHQFVDDHSSKLDESPDPRAARVYLACPYSHPDPKVMDHRKREADMCAAKLMAKGHVVFSPLSHSRSIADHLPDELRCNWEFWQGQDLPLIDWADEVHVLTMPGWNVSVGVTVEIERARAAGKPVRFIPHEGGHEPSRPNNQPSCSVCGKGPFCDLEEWMEHECAKGSKGDE